MRHDLINRSLQTWGNDLKHIYIELLGLLSNTCQLQIQSHHLRAFANVFDSS